MKGGGGGGVLVLVPVHVAPAADGGLQVFVKAGVFSLTPAKKIHSEEEEEEEEEASG